MTKKLLNFINGEYVEPSNGQYLKSMNPSTGEVLCMVPDSDAMDINKAVDAAKEAMKLWSKWTANERAEVMNKIADEMEARRADFAKAESQDQGKTYALAYDIEVPRAISNFRFFAACIMRGDSHAYDMDGKGINYTLRQPIGVTGLISPWNLPLYLITWKIAPAIAMGNTAVCKPSELTSLTASMLGEVFNKVGLPKGVCNIVMGRGPTVGEALTSHPDVPLISFTGGTATAEHISKAAAPYFKKLGLELGGKNPNIVFADANMEKCVVTTVKSSFQNQGEICLCGSRIFVEKPIFDEFLKRFIEETKKFKVGDPQDPSSNMGALVSYDHMNKVLGYIDQAKQEGATIAFGGKRIDMPAPLDKGFFIEPTIITNVEMNCSLMQEEVFGPVVTIVPFDGVEDALEKANDVKYGLSASVWTQDISKAHKVAGRIEVGTVWINTWMRRDLRVPFGGIKASGIGREGGEFSMDFYSELKNICIDFES